MGPRPQGVEEGCDVRVIEVHHDDHTSTRLASILLMRSGIGNQTIRVLTRVAHSGKDNHVVCHAIAVAVRIRTDGYIEIANLGAVATRTSMRIGRHIRIGEQADGPALGYTFDRSKAGKILIIIVQTATDGTITWIILS